ncbi:tannase and feruloyl esterase [Massarina eburnea CBS 473.64]|uniref:Carboxylic ester hydrolase n=1 Tax=Massarina eburnea CBS 473.64 TaxID=1395130 RepID=A0A6A6S9E2_9PLEO|nr:tannase and feruloyl esterase [Massarina eburnea CBS 473.64]
MNGDEAVGSKCSHRCTAANDVEAVAASLVDLCTVSNVQAALPANGTLLGLNLLPGTVTASPVYNASTAAGGMKKRQAPSSSSSSTTYSYCNVTVSYVETGRSTPIPIKLAFPEPSNFNSRWYLAGGGGYSLSTAATGGLAYGAASGATSAGYDAFDYSLDEVVLYGNGSLNWDAIRAFSYKALGDLTTIGKTVTPSFYGISNSTDSKLYTYFEGCSDGGRQAMSQVQRWGEMYDGVVAGAPAFRQAQQQVNHIYPATVEHVTGYIPPPCALDKIVNATIEACDPLDGRTDGVISRTDLCQLNFNLSSLIGTPFYCAATTSSSLGFGIGKRQAGNSQSQTSTTPAQNGTITSQDVMVAQTVYDGLHSSDGKRAYLSWQIGSSLSDADSTYDNTTASWAINIPATGGVYTTKFVEMLDLDNLETIDGVDYDKLIEWMNIGFFRYDDTLQTTVPDLTPFQSTGGKLLHYHGESDPSVPAASSVHYIQAVRSIMYPNITDDTAAYSALSDWYQLYLVPGAAHCSANSLQPDGPYPQDNMATIIDWVEKDIKPSALNATVSSGADAKEVQQLCQWPKRPLWVGNSSSFDCVDDKESIESWTYTFDAFKVPVY